MWGSCLRIINEALPFEVDPLEPGDINRCHPIGKPNKKTNRQIIIKFNEYKAKAKAYDARFNLSNVYMTEDFTPSNQKLVNQVVQLKKAKHIKKFWSIDGKIFAKVVDVQVKFRIQNTNDIVEMFKNAVEEGYVDADEAPEVGTQQMDVQNDSRVDESVSLLQLRMSNNWMNPKFTNE